MVYYVRRRDELRLISRNRRDFAQKIMTLKEKIKTALAYVKSQTIESPQTAILLGSGMHKITEMMENPVIFSTQEIPYYPISTVPGHHGQWLLGQIEKQPTLIINGRIHYYEGYSSSEMAFPIHLVAALGVKNLIITTASGGINPSFKPGDLMLITDHINFAFMNPLIVPPEDQLGSRFPDSTSLYDPSLLGIAQQSCQKLGISVHTGVFCWMLGPAYETPAEIRMLKILGVDAVSMSTVPEVIIANQRHLRVLGISIITNHAAGLFPAKITHNDVLQTSDHATGTLRQVLQQILRELPPLFCLKKTQ
jgi:purine-nucleoside phosphorylase